MHRELSLRPDAVRHFVRGSPEQFVQLRGVRADVYCWHGVFRGALRVSGANQFVRGRVRRRAERPCSLRRLRNGLPCRPSVLGGFVPIELCGVARDVRGRVRRHGFRREQLRCLHDHLQRWAELRGGKLSVSQWTDVVRGFVRRYRFQPDALWRVHHRLCRHAGVFGRCLFGLLWQRAHDLRRRLCRHDNGWSQLWRLLESVHGRTQVRRGDLSVPVGHDRLRGCLRGHWYRPIELRRVQQCLPGGSRVFERHLHHFVPERDALVFRIMCEPRE